MPLLLGLQGLGGGGKSVYHGYLHSDPCFSVSMQYGYQEQREDSTTHVILMQQQLL